MLIELRPLTPADQPLIWDFLYHAIYVSEKESQPSRSVLDDPKIAHYAADWGCVGDVGFMAIENKTPVGAAWLRLVQGYGFVEGDIPELTIAVLPDYRGRGIGTALLAKLIDTAAQSYRAISLSVVGENPAMNFYHRMGFEIVRLDGESYTMILRLKND